MLPWEQRVKAADWQSFNDIKLDFGDADQIGDERVVFNIRGNHYRLIAIVKIRNHRVYVRWIGTHAAYDEAVRRIDPLLDLNPAPGSSEDDELDVLSTLVEAYENQHYPTFSFSIRQYDYLRPGLVAFSKQFQLSIYK